MAKFRCVCGHIIHTSGEIPHPYQWNLLSDVAFDGADAHDIDALYMQATIMFRCPNSGHLWIYWDGLDRAPYLYTPTDFRSSRDG